MNEVPLVRELLPAPSVEVALRKLRHLNGLVLFDSSLQRMPLGRYSFLAAEPFEVSVTQTAVFGENPFARIAPVLSRFSASPIPGLPPFQGGAAGLLSYELGQCFERLPVAATDEFQIPAAVIGIYSWVLAWDHLQGRCWFIGHGYPEQNAEARAVLARQHFEMVQGALNGQSENDPHSPSGSSAEQVCEERLHFDADRTFSLPYIPGLLSNFPEPAYLAAVERVIDYIFSGDIFQANLSQRLLIPAVRPALEQYLLLRKQNPAPFAGFFSHEDWTVMSSSPERFLQLSGREVSTRPIKGTRRRFSIPEADLYTRDELRESEKDRAENVMIVDLLRNDLSRVCEPGSIRVPELCVVEAYETVSHLVSEVRGQLRTDVDFWDLLRATFPGGSITGAPKIRAMQIITELEQVARGPYCGSLFYCGFDGTADSNILIRTMTQRHGWLTFAAGGGVVSQSDPLGEYEETLHKARGLLNSLR
ncbi:anthranilate synthase component I family protein [Planctomicrobium sp. SH661]|uniref:anthranilate synthase component I family protein n=1 Tax=Planctomicrobium sp. SH661 TaxID=3448124 RepID=UPI003F5C07C3